MTHPSDANHRFVVSDMVGIVETIIAGKGGGKGERDERHQQQACVWGEMRSWRDAQAFFFRDCGVVGHALLVDDDGLVLSIEEAGFSRLGYKATICRDGREAYDLLKANGSNSFDVIITEL